MYTQKLTLLRLVPGYDDIFQAGVVVLFHEGHPNGAAELKGLVAIHFWILIICDFINVIPT